MPPSGLPEAFIADVPGRDGAARAPLRAHARPVRDARAARRATALDLTPVLERLEQRRRARARRAAPRRHARASGATPRCCGGCAAPRWPRCARRSSRPTSARSPASRPSLAGRRPPPAGRRGRRPPARGARPAAGPRAAARGVGARRAAAPHRRLLAGVAGPAVRVAARSCGSARARSGRRSGRVALYFREDAPLLGPPPTRRASRPPEPVHEAIRERLRAGAVLLHRPADRRRRLPDRGAPERAVGPRVGGRGDQRRVRAAALAEARPPTPPWSQRARAERRRTFGSRRRGGAQPAVQGRWSLTARAVRPATTIRPPAAAPRPSCCSSATASSPASRCWPRASPAASRRLRLAGGAGDDRRRPPRLLRRGPRRRAVRAARARSSACARSSDDDAAPPIVLAATDPAQPYGAALKWPDTPRRPARQAGAYVVLAGAEPVLFVERGGKGLQVLVDGRRPARRAVARRARRRRPARPHQAARARARRRRAGRRLRLRGARCSSSASAPARASSR